MDSPGNLIRRARKEHLVGLYLDSQNGLLHRETISIGSLNTTRTHPREILYPALVHLALGLLLLVRLHARASERPPAGPAPEVEFVTVSIETHTPPPPARPRARYFQSGGRFGNGNAAGRPRPRCCRPAGPGAAG